MKMAPSLSFAFLAVMLIFFARYVAALECLTSDGGFQRCSRSAETCTAFTYFGSTYQGCMDKFSGSEGNNCESIKSLDPNACCCDFDKCNTVTNCGEKVKTTFNKRVLQATLGPTHAPTTFAQSDSQFCAVPIDWNFGISIPCEFGSPLLGWTFTNSTVLVPGLRGCVTVAEYEPLDALDFLLPTDKWCPTVLNSNGVYDASTQDWGLCECSPCRINPNAEPSGIANNGLCDFGTESTWVYIAANGTAFAGLFQCVKVRDYPPLGYIDMKVDLDSLWCPGSLNFTNSYDLRNTEAAQSWGICECASTPSPTSLPTSSSPTVQVTTSSPTIQPSDATVSPTPVFTLEGEYCFIQNSTEVPLSSGQCNFGSTGAWNYLGVDGLIEDGLVGCVPVGAFPPRLEGSARTIDESALWCPGAQGLGPDSLYNISDLSGSLQWGLCSCGPCRVLDAPGGLNAFRSGLCGFDETGSWTYSFANGTIVVVSGCVSVDSLAPFGLDSGVPGSTLWCPGSSNYIATFQGGGTNWGLCTCLATDSPTVVAINTEAPSSQTPSISPSVASPSRSPIFSMSFPGLQNDAYCQIVQTTLVTTSELGEVCAVGPNGTWSFTTPNNSMTGCVAIGQFSPFGAGLAGLDASTMWCPGKSALNDQGVYDILTSPDPLNWGICACSSCEITTEVEGQFVGPVQSGPCSFGPNRTWEYKPTSGDSSFMVGCAVVDDFPPFPYDSQIDPFPPGTRWCPAPGGLSPTGVYAFDLLQSDPLAWGLCDCDTTEPPTPQTSSPISTPTVFGETRRPTASPTNRPTTPFPSRSPSTGFTDVPTSSPTCCRLVDGGPVGIENGGQCDFGFNNSWDYSSFGAVQPNLAGCVPIDDYLPFGGGPFRKESKRWCATSNPQGLVDGRTYVYEDTARRMNWGLCECPCIPTPAPTSRAPTVPIAELDKLALFIQADHSGSIRVANKKCRAQTGGKMTCWELLSDFVRNFVQNITNTLGGPDKVRVYISTFTCVNSNPTAKVLTNGLTAAGDWTAVDAALKRLKGMKESTMQGTCPSLGISKMLPVMDNLPLEWPVAYFIVTDGKVQTSDESKYARNVKAVRTRMLARGRDSVCASTVGVADVGEINRLLRTKCIFPATDFIEIATSMYSSNVAMNVLQRTFAHTTIGDGDSPAPDPQNKGPFSDIPRSPVTQDKGTKTAVSVGVGIVAFGLVLTASIFFLVTKRRNRRHVSKPHRQPDDIFWVNNPTRPASPSPVPMEHGGNQQPRRRSRASSDLFIELPAPPPIPILDQQDTSVLNVSLDSIGLGSPHPSFREEFSFSPSLLRPSPEPARLSSTPSRPPSRSEWALSPFSSSGTKSTRPPASTARFDSFKAKETHLGSPITPAPKRSFAIVAAPGNETPSSAWGDSLSPWSAQKKHSPAQ